MLPQRLYITCHGLGHPAADIEPDARRFWLPADLFRHTLDVAQVLERDTGISVQFTFDDGNLSDHTVALPLLRAHNRRALFFVCAERIGRPGFLDRARLREMVAAGMTIGCHGHRHVSWRTLSDAALASELSSARRAIAEVTGQPVVLASAPFGELDQRVVRATMAEGFRCLFSSSGGFATAQTGLIPRNTLKSDFEPGRDLPRMAGLPQRAWAGVYDTARRMKYRFT